MLRPGGDAMGPLLKFCCVGLRNMGASGFWSPLGLVDAADILLVCANVSISDNVIIFFIFIYLLRVRLIHLTVKHKIMNFQLICSIDFLGLLTLYFF